MASDGKHDRHVDREVPTETGGGLVASALSAAGVENVFTLHGGHLDAFLVECARHGLRLIDTRHEASAGHAADGWARTTGKPGVCVVTSGPGFTNAVTAIANAYLDRVPVLFIVGAPPLREAETNELQGGVDQIAVAKPIVKWAVQVTTPEQIPSLISLALKKATSGAPGPVLLEIPIDVMFRSVRTAMVRFPERYSASSRPAASEAQIGAALDRLVHAAKPAIVVGGGVLFSPEAARSVAELAQLIDAPVFSASKAAGVIPSGERLDGGNIRTIAEAIRNGESPDLVLILGARSGLYDGARNSFFSRCSVIQVDVDEAEIGRNYDVDQAIVSDIGEFSRQLTQTARSLSWPSRGAWLDTVSRTRLAHVDLFSTSDTQSGRIHPYFAAKELVEAAPADTIWVTDGAEVANWAAHHLTYTRAGDVLRQGYLGALGIGPGFAIGAQIASPDRPVVQFTGDGAIGFGAFEFETMVRHRLPIVTVVYNNLMWGMSAHGQKAVYGDAGVVISLLPDTNYEQVCQALGGYGERVTALEDLGPALKRALASGLPACLNVEIDPEIVHPNTLRALGELNDPAAIVIPYYENIPR